MESMARWRQCVQPNRDRPGIASLSENFTRGGPSHTIKLSYENEHCLLLSRWSLEFFRPTQYTPALVDSSHPVKLDHKPNKPAVPFIWDLRLFAFLCWDISKERVVTHFEILCFHHITGLDSRNCLLYYFSQSQIHFLKGIRFFPSFTEAMVIVGLIV